MQHDHRQEQPHEGGPATPLQHGTVAALASPIFTPEEAGEYLKLRQLGFDNPAGTLKYLIKTRQIRYTKIAGRVAFHREHLDEYAARHDGKAGG